MNLLFLFDVSSITKTNGKYYGVILSSTSAETTSTYTIGFATIYMRYFWAEIVAINRFVKAVWARAI